MCSSDVALAVAATAAATARRGWGVKISEDGLGDGDGELRGGLLHDGKSVVRMLVRIEQEFVVRL